jgi:hypothetical protein
MEVRVRDAKDLASKVRRGLDSLRSLDLEGARREFADLARRDPADPFLAWARELVHRLSGVGSDFDGLVQAFEGARRDLRPPIVEVEEESAGHSDLPDRVRRELARTLAERAEEKRGSAGRAGGVPVARLWIEASDADRARTCAEAILGAEGESAELVACLADAYFVSGDAVMRAEARDLYRRALVLDPRGFDLAAVVDPEVRDLLSLAELEYEVPGDPVEWLATVGFLERVLPIAHFGEADWARAGERGLLEPPVVEEDPRSFYHYLRVSESWQVFGDRGEALRVEARKRLKAVAPEVYARYLQRF